MASLDDEVDIPLLLKAYPHLCIKHIVKELTSRRQPAGAEAYKDVSSEADTLMMLFCFLIGGQWPLPDGAEGLASPKR